MTNTPDEMATPEPLSDTAEAITWDSGEDAAQPMAAAEDLLPVLPKGDPLFDGIPTRAVVLEELAPALGDGALVVRRSAQVGVVLIRERTLFETYCFSPTERLYGRAAMDAMKSWDDATVSAYRLEPELVDVCPSLLRGEILYSDLRLGWTDWNQLLADLQARDGNYVVEVRTPQGRGVTCIANGKQIATFTEAHPELGAPSLLDALAASRNGTVWVHSEPAILDEEEWAASQIATAAEAPSTASPAAKPIAAPTVLTPAVEPEDIAELVAAEADNAADSAPEPQLTPSAPAPVVNPFAAAAPSNGAAVAPSNGAAPAPAEEFANPFTAVFGAGPGPKRAGATVQDLLPELKAIARNRLQRSAARVEAMLDDAAGADKPLDAVLEDIRGVVIRGVMQSTLDEVVDEMRNLAETHAV